MFDYSGHLVSVGMF